MSITSSITRPMAGRLVNEIELEIEIVLGYEAPGGSIEPPARTAPERLRQAGCRH
jgi:hypothetical protein